MRRSFDRLARERFDVLVVGAGIHGAWTARAAALRGLSVALIEAEDLASGTTSRSTMLAHGGLRYLAQFDLGLVREALVERGILTRKAPHLVQPIPFILPFYKGAPYPKWQLEVGIRAYTWLARGSGYPPHRFLGKGDLLALEPGLRAEGLRGGALYYDGQILSPERLTTAVAMDAADHGACVVNHARVSALVATGRIKGAIVEDAFTHEEVEVGAPVVLNTTGPFLDQFLTSVGAHDGLLRLTKGIHLVTPQFTKHAIVVNAPDGRTFFAIPWNGYELIGTTDTDYTEDPRDVHATAEDVRYLRDAVVEFFPDAPADRVLATNAGLRNLLLVEGVHPSQVTRRALVRDHSEEGFAGLLSLAGGKLTTARATAAELVDAVAPFLQRAAPRIVDDRPLPGGDVDLAAATRDAQALCAKAGADASVAGRLVRLFGSRWHEVAREGLEPLCAHSVLVRGEAVQAARREAAWTVEDVVRRRTLAWVTPCRSLDGADAVADVLVHEGVPEAVARASTRAWAATCELHDRWRNAEHTKA